VKLHILTACTRFENLPKMAACLQYAARTGVDLTWHVRFDPERQAVGGQLLKNQMLDQVADGWVYILDDDNILHPDLVPALADYLADRVDVQLIVCAQQHRNGFIRRPHRQMLRQTHVDAGQVIIRREAIGLHRIPLHYCGDGEFIEALANRLPNRAIVYVPEPTTYYNWLREG
jgi:hypothetical protein